MREPPGPRPMAPVELSNFAQVKIFKYASTLPVSRFLSGSNRKHSSGFCIHIALLRGNGRNQSHRITLLCRKGFVLRTHHPRPRNHVARLPAPALEKMYKTKSPGVISICGTIVGSKISGIQNAYVPNGNRRAAADHSGARYPKKMFAKIRQPTVHAAFMPNENKNPNLPWGLCVARSPRPVPETVSSKAFVLKLCLCYLSCKYVMVR